MRRWLGLLFVCVLASACSGGGSGGSPTAPTPPPSPPPAAGPALPPTAGVFTFDFVAATSASDQALIHETVQFASAFLLELMGRGVQQATTISTSTTSGGCVSGGASAFTGPRTMTLCVANQGWMVHGPVNRRKIVIHEVFHLVQFEQRWLGGPGPAGHHWLIEGAAEYLGWRGAAHLGLVGMETALGCMAKEVADFAQQQPPGLPNLSALETGASFNRPGPLYPLSMIGADRLIASAGIAAVTAYGAAIASGTAQGAAFQTAFGTSTAAFYDTFPGYLATRPVPPTYECRL